MNNYTDYILIAIFSFGTIQSLTLSTLLLKKKPNYRANSLLAFALALLGVELLYCIYELTMIDTYPQFIGSTIGIPLLYAPLFYYFVYLLGDETRVLKLKHYLLLLPFFLFYGSMQFLLHSHSIIERLNLIDNNFAEHKFFSILVALLPIVVAVFMFLVIAEIRQINKRIKDVYSKIDFKNLYWLNSFSFGILIAIVLVITLHLIEHLLPFNIKYPVFIFMSFWFSFLGYVTLKQPEVKIHINNSKDEEIATSVNDIKQSYSRSGLSDDEAKVIIVNLKNLMETEKPYRNPDLNLNQLAIKLNVSLHNLSQVLNQYLNQNFYDFINSYRAEEFIRLMETDKEKRYSILALSYDAGFNSKTAFYKIFKKIYNQTPSEYRDKGLNNPQ
ncbi:MAG: helix-turn-helix domain-containing protein [Ignavibacteria bacterium]|nr:helix-turn-helix domain-containing protein [Ignavibacteria bacterium]